MLYIFSWMHFNHFNVALTRSTRSLLLLFKKWKVFPKHLNLKPYLTNNPILGIVVLFRMHFSWWFQIHYWVSIIVTFWQFIVKFWPVVCNLPPAAWRVLRWQLPLMPDLPQVSLFIIYQNIKRFSIGSCNKILNR